MKVSGSIYFLRERDFITAQVSPYVKIGLVRKDKPTEKRILEHQTGNPREIFDFQSIEASFVEDLETRLHYMYGEYWITGEWFKLNDEKLKSVIETAQNYAAYQKQLTPFIEDVEKMSSLIADENLIEANGEMKDIWEELIAVKSELIREQAIQTIAELKLRILLGVNKGIDGIVEVQVSKPSATFNKSEFIKDSIYSDYSERYMKEIPSKQSSSFLLKNNPTLKKVDPDLDSLVKNLKTPKLTVEDLTENVLNRTTEMEELHLVMIVQASKLSVLEWKIFELETKLKWHTGSAMGIDGISTWKRELKPASLDFDAARFKEDYPEIAEKFYVTPTPTIKHPFAKFRSYPH